MIRFVQTPNLPQHPVKTLICGKTDEKLYDYIKGFNIDIIVSQPNQSVDRRISHHVDISVHHVGAADIVIDKKQLQLYDKLKTYGMNVLLNKQDLCESYPNDCSLNFARIGKQAFGRYDCIDMNLLNLLKQKQVNIIDVKQGYSKCSSCVISDDALITDDESIYKAAISSGLDCLFISKGDIKLDGFEYGFIGGASGLIDKNHLIFFGDVRQHNDYYAIERFLIKHNCKFSYLENYPLTDIGGIVSIIESA
ncbi:MAG: hypothetical protein NC122_00585 [Faecalibacterium sp.]|nr:hypothetical protein [Ruminococcus sp.]MCM1392802.1 hypothetical protein [Ruminococcus sp.]MCM1484684.1 hypothetical protein [Faecalibacterium sp.]